MHIHILGICGTFMGGVALLAQQKGFRVSGQDQNVYPPMSTQLQQQGIELVSGYEADYLRCNEPDMVVIGNALSRGCPAVEYTLNHHLPYRSGAQWLSEFILNDKWVLAVSGTHGKTTTSSILAWILEYAGLKPGFLIGGVPENFGLSARHSDSIFFVVEADEYDTAFFDKRSKFVHYHPKTVIINNIEFDHADIFADLQAIETQFHHFVRTIPSEGLIIRSQVGDEKDPAFASSQAIDRVLKRGCWTPVQSFSSTAETDWRARIIAKTNGKCDGSVFEIYHQGHGYPAVQWRLIGRHNVENALAAVAAAHHAGVPVAVAVAALSAFKNVKRRMELKAKIHDVAIYDDFAHHPSAIATTLNGLRQQVGTESIYAILEPRSNTMKMQIHNQHLPQALQQADRVFFFLPQGYENRFDDVVAALGDKISSFNDLNAMIQAIEVAARQESSRPLHLLVMSNGSFGGLHEQLQQRLEENLS